MRSSPVELHGRIIRRALWALVLPLVVALQAAEHLGLPPSAAATRQELTAVVLRQIDALKMEDFAGAYACAASGIRQKFSLEAFADMVRGSYPSLLQTRLASVLTCADAGGHARLEVRIVTTAGVLAHFRYFLEIENHAWRIVGVVPFEPPTTRA